MVPSSTPSSTPAGRPSRAPGRPAPVLAAAALLLLVPLAACSDAAGGEEDRREAAAAVAEDLAAGLAAGDLDGVPLADGVDAATATAELGEVLDGLGDLEPDVALVEDSVTVAADDATAAVRWSWPLASGAWTYEAPVRLVPDPAGDGEGEDGWAAAWSREVVEPSLGAEEVLDATALEPARADILGRRGARLMTSRPVARIGVDKTEVRPAVAVRSARAVAEAVGVEPGPYAEQVRAAGPEAFVEAIVLRQEDTGGGLARRLRAIPGALSIGTTRPLAPSRDFAAALLGRVGEATAEVVEESGGRVQPGDVVGLSGLSGRYDEELSGTPGVSVRAVDDTGAARVLHQVDPVDGTPLRTTLDLDLQGLAEQVLADVGPPSGLVALQPSTGAVLAAASGPGSEGYSTATFAQYAPGSTFKVVTALALLRGGVTPTTPLSCEPTVRVDGKVFGNYSDFPTADLGRLPLRGAIASSCNTALIDARDRTDPAALTDAAAALGLGVDHDLGFPAYFGEVPAPESATDAAAALIGQGRVTASPLAMAAVVASVQEGRAVLPRLLPDLAVDQEPVAAPLTRPEARDLRAMLRAVVTEGTGSALADVPGPPVLAKTGTAEYGRPDAAGELRTHAWMVAAQGDLAVAVVVEDGQSGSGTAGPLLERFLRGAR